MVNLSASILCLHNYFFWKLLNFELFLIGWLGLSLKKAEQNIKNQCHSFLNHLTDKQNVLPKGSLKFGDNT